MKKRAVMIVGLFLLSAFAMIDLPVASAADMGYLEVVENQWGIMNNRYVNNGNAFYFGDQDITFGVTVENLMYEYIWVALLGWTHNYRIMNLTMEVTGQKDMLGNTVNVLDFSGGSSTADYGGNVDGSAVTVYGLQANVVDKGVAGSYNISLRFTYDYQWVDATDTLRYTSTKVTDSDYVFIRIDDGVTVGTVVRVFNEYDSMLGHYLYSGTTFQKVGVYVHTDVGIIGEVYATITLSSQAASYITLDNPVAYTIQISDYIYFKYRVDVKDGTDPGRYDATLEIKYQRWYGEDNERTVTAQTIAIEFIVDFTPLLQIQSPESYTITQGALNTNLTEVTLKNIGNTELKKIRVWIDIWNYFEENQFYFQGDGGSKTLLPTEDEKEKMGKGETWQVDFMNINVFKYLPEGEHRLPLSYEGYYYDDGTAGGSTDYKLTDANTYLAIKGEELYIKVIVNDGVFNLEVESGSSINLGTKMKDITVVFTVDNIEAVNLLYTKIKVGTKDGTTQVLINPEDPSLDHLDIIDVPVFPAQGSMTFTLNADVAQDLTEDFYELPVKITGFNGNTKTWEDEDTTLKIRVNAEPPRLIVTDVQYPPEVTGRISPGKTFELNIVVKNDGEDDARDVFVTLLESQRDSEVTVTTDFTPDAAKAEGAIEPFSTEISRIYIGDIAPGETKGVNYTIKVDKNIVKGRNYEMWVTLDYNDDLNRAWTYNTEISIFAQGSQPEQEPDYSGITNPLLVGFLLIILVFILALAYMKIRNRPKRSYGPPPSGDDMVDTEPAPREASPPPPPPSGQVQQAQPVKAGGGDAQTFKVCPACHKSVPANNMTCPHCGCAL